MIVEKTYGADVDAAILSLWRSKLDTFAIGEKLHLRESYVANRLAALRHAAQA